MSSRAFSSRGRAVMFAFALASSPACGGEQTVPRNASVAALQAPAAGMRLSELGLYVDVPQEELAPGLLEFAPRFPLWTDGAVKRRFLRLPPGAHIDATDPDHFEFPVGTMLFKEFSKGGRRVETRVIARTGGRASDYFMGAFAWNADGSDALFVPDGVTDALGTEHDVPNASACWTCHAGEPGRVLGFSAVQRPDAPAELFAVAPPSRFVPPGDDVARAALGYLHANCGHCHNAHGSARPDTDMDLRLSVSEQKPEQTAAYRTTVGRSLRAFDAPGLRVRVARGQPEQSALVHRMLQRQNDTAMPPLGSERVDPAGIAAVAAWIEAL